MNTMKKIYITNNNNLYRRPGCLQLDSDSLKEKTLESDLTQHEINNLSRKKRFGNCDWVEGPDLEQHCK